MDTGYTLSHLFRRSSENHQEHYHICQCLHKGQKGVETNPKWYVHHLICLHPHCRKSQSPEEIPRSKGFQHIWAAKIPNKMKLFLWILHHERTKTNYRLNTLGMSLSPAFHNRRLTKKYITHLFFQYYIISTFWKEVQTRKPLTNTLDSSSLDVSS